MGFVNVRLQHISDDTIISVGNIAYHFKNKEALVSALFGEWEKLLKEALIEFRHTPIFANVDRIFTSTQEVQEQYRFFFTDILEIQRAFPALFHKIQQFLQWQVFLFQEILRFNMARGAMRELTDPQVAFVAKLVIEHLYSWPSRNLIWQSFDQTTASQQLSSFIWQLLNPYFTDLGQEELRVYQDQNIRISSEED